MTEIWKQVKGFPLYEVSNLGRVKSKHHSKRHPNGGLIIGCKTSSGYLKVFLSDGKGNQKQQSVHRLVAQAFIPNPSGKLTINHKDGNKTNNSVDNLEWSTYSENIRHAFDSGLNKWSPAKGKPPIPVYQCDPNTGEKICLFRSINEANNATRKGKSASTGITKCLRGEMKTCNGFKWELAT